MAIDLSALAADLTAAINDLPDAVTWNGTTFNAVVGDIESEDDLEIAGVTERANLSVDYVLAAAGGTIAENDILTIRGNDYRVVKVFDLPDQLTGRVLAVREDE
jgi:hypothetical protein